jgi:ribosome biogenesis protein SSF1/2
VDTADGTAAQNKVPKSFVLKRGKVGMYVSQLVQDMRRVMQPYTALKLKERKRAALKDYVSVAGSLGVTHMLMFSKTDASVNLRVGRLPRGPTLSFQVNQYCLSGDLKKAQRRPIDAAIGFKHPPLLVINNFDDSKQHLKLVSMTFQKMFPAINIQTIRLSECRRVVLLDYDQANDVVEVRHFFVRATPTGVTRSVKRIVETRLPNLSTATDVSEVILGNSSFATVGGGGLSESEYEDGGNEVVLPQDFAGKGNKKSSQSAIKLSEIGPRMTLKLRKVESGLGEGDVLYHAFNKRSGEEVRALKAKKDMEKTDKLKRKREQEENVESKKAKLAAKKQAKEDRRKARLDAIQKEMDDALSKKRDAEVTQDLGKEDASDSNSDTNDSGSSDDSGSSSSSGDEE